VDYGPLHGKPGASLLWRRLRPALSLRWHGQARLQRDRIPEGARRLLWIYKGSPQIGDSLMDLSSRALLVQRGIAVDLVTDAHLAGLYRSDRFFGRVFDAADAADPADYDLVLLDSLKWRCIEAKIGRLRGLPFATMRGVFSGPEFNRTLFSFFRMKQLLGLDTPERTLRAMAKPAMFASSDDEADADALKIPPGAVAVALGGADPVRSYAHWPEALSAFLRATPHTPLVLLGSKNALAARDAVLAQLATSSGTRLVDAVDRLTLPQTFAALERCTLAIAADGGLLHVAHAASVPTVALFDRHIAPALRLTPANHSLPLQSPAEVSALPPEQVGATIREALDRYAD